MDLEARVHAEHPQSLRLWLRLLTCTQLIERDVRGRLRRHFDTTLPRFDLMAQLERAPHGLRMNELSKRLMVSGGNVTGITDQLVIEGLVERNRRTGRPTCPIRIRLTKKGRAQFADMARAHEGWIVDAFAGLNEREVAALHRLLGKVKAQHRQGAPDGSSSNAHGNHALETTS